MGESPKDRTVGDVAHEVARAIVAAIPAVGGPLQVPVRERVSGAAG